MVYKLTARMGQLSIAQPMNSEQPRFRPLLNKRIIVVSHAPEKINFNIKVAKEHQLTALIFKQGVSKVEVELERDAY